MTTADLLGKIIQVVAALAAFSLVIGLVLFLIDKAPKRGRDYWQLAFFLLPAVILLLVGLIYPAFRTTLLAFSNSSGDWVGAENFIWMFTQPAALVTLGNTVIWVICVPIISTAIGLAYAMFIDKSRGEKYFKALVFMPMAISFVGAGIIWRFVYDYKSGGNEQIGLLNQIMVWVGLEPVQSGRVWIGGKDCTTVPAHQRVGLGVALSPEGRGVFGEDRKSVV